MASLVFGTDTSSSPGVRKDAALDDRVIGLTATGSVELEQYLVLRRALERARVTEGRSMIAVTSPTSNDGKTTTAINVAAVLARSRESSVLLIDADLRLPSVASRLGLPAGRPGLVELITDSTLNLGDAVRPYPASNLSVLSAGALGDANPYELFQSPRLGALLAQARRAYGFIVMDTPPVIPVADCRVIESLVDGFLVVVAAGRTPRRVLAETLTILGPAKTIGLVLNRVVQPFEGAYAEYGYHSKSAGRAR